LYLIFVCFFLFILNNFFFFFWSFLWSILGHFWSFLVILAYLFPEKKERF